MVVAIVVDRVGGIFVLWWLRSRRVFLDSSCGENCSPIHAPPAVNTLLGDDREPRVEIDVAVPVLSARLPTPHRGGQRLLVERTESLRLRTRLAAKGCRRRGCRWSGSTY